ncbi:MAG: M3 family oligoendopeptidase [Actinomycetota bacterium]
MTIIEDVEQVSWNLEPLVEGKGPEGVDGLLDDADRVAEELTAARGTLADIDAAGLASLMRKVEQVQVAITRAGTYAGLRYAADANNPEHGALLQKVQERATAIGTKLIFIELEWAALDDAKVDELLADDAVDFCRHHLRMERRYRDHLLSEPEEKILAEKNVTGRSAWERLFDELISALEVTIDGEKKTFEEAASILSSPDRDQRRAVQEAITEALKPGLKTRSFLFNTILADKAIDDRLRNYPNWIRSRNLSNEASDESVQALVDAVVARYDIPQRWYGLKAKAWGLDRIADYDRIASLTDDDERVEWPEAIDIVLESYASFSPDLARLARQFFEDRWVDAPVRPGKRLGAFCSYSVPSLHPYVFLNFTHKRKDVLTMAQELGHGLHAALSRPQGIFHFHTPLTVAETASVFGETVTVGRLLDEAPDASSRFSLMAESVERSIATVFRQIAMNRFEDTVHNARRSEGELSTERINELWTETQGKMFGDSVEITDNYRVWWSYIPHFIGSPGYVYAYAYGELLALAVYKRYRDVGPAFVPKYIEMLSAGGSMPPEELGKIVDCDLTDPDFWSGGIQIIEDQLNAAEAAGKEAGIF